jgi:hypothetical protein
MLKPVDSPYYQTSVFRFVPLTKGDGRRSRQGVFCFPHLHIHSFSAETGKDLGVVLRGGPIYLFTHLSLIVRSRRSDHASMQSCISFLFLESWFFFTLCAPRYALRLFGLRSAVNRCHVLSFDILVQITIPFSNGSAGSVFPP